MWKSLEAIMDSPFIVLFLNYPMITLTIKDYSTMNFDFQSLERFF